MSGIDVREKSSAKARVQSPATTARPQTGSVFSAARADRVCPPLGVCGIWGTLADPTQHFPESTTEFLRRFTIHHTPSSGLTSSNPDPNMANDVQRTTVFQRA